MPLKLVSVTDPEIRNLSPAAMREAKAAKYLGIGINTLRKLVAADEIVARKIGQQRVYLKRDLDEYLEALPRAEARAKIAVQGPTNSQCEHREEDS